MASEDVRAWHAQQMEENRQRVLDRIAMGTKASSPQILAARLANPLLYHSTLPDNSSGSKSRPFGGGRDDSGRPTADQMVYLLQQKEAQEREAMEGGIRNFAVAQQLLANRRRDYEELEALKEGLPPAPRPENVLSDLESKDLELNILLRSISDAIESNALDNLQVSELKNVPRLLIYLAPHMDESRATEITQFINSQLEELRAYSLRHEEDTKEYDLINRVFNILTEFKEFIEVGILKLVNLPYDQRVLGANDAAKKILHLKSSEAKLPREEAALDPAILQDLRARIQGFVGNTPDNRKALVQFVKENRQYFEGKTGIIKNTGNLDDMKRNALKKLKKAPARQGRPGGAAAPEAEAE